MAVTSKQRHGIIKRESFASKGLNEERRINASVWLCACLLCNPFHSLPFYPTIKESFPFLDDHIGTIISFLSCSLVQLWDDSILFFFFVREKKNETRAPNNMIIESTRIKRLLVLQKFFCKVKNTMKNSVCW